GVRRASPLWLFPLRPPGPKGKQGKRRCSPHSKPKPPGQAWQDLPTPPPPTPHRPLPEGGPPRSSVPTPPPPPKGGTEEPQRARRGRWSAERRREEARMRGTWKTITLCLAGALLAASARADEPRWRVATTQFAIASQPSSAPGVQIGQPVPLSEAERQAPPPA